MNKIKKCIRISDTIEEYHKQLDECFKNGNCKVIDRGLANCGITGKYCDMSRCPNLFKGEK